VVVSALAAFFTVTIHIIPAQFSHYVFEFAATALEAKSHIKIGTTFINVPIGAVIPSLALLFYEICANFKIMTKVASLTIRA
jgi:hypothetical protein